VLICPEFTARRPPKDETKNRLDRNPDEMDSPNQAFSGYTILPPSAVPKQEPQRLAGGVGVPRAAAAVRAAGAKTVWNSLPIAGSKLASGPGQVRSISVSRSSAPCGTPSAAA
jgi:hypothetical protein